MSDMAFAGGAISAGIRGLTFDDLEKTFETTVGAVIDGVFAASNSGVDFDLLILSLLKYFVDLKVQFLEEIQLVVLLILLDQNQLENLELKLNLILKKIIQVMLSSFLIHL